MLGLATLGVAVAGYLTWVHSSGATALFALSAWDLMALDRGAAA